MPQLMQPPVPLSNLVQWASKLASNCGFWGQWVAKQGSVKEHIKRLHPAIWDVGLDAFITRCEDYRDLITRDHDCELCNYVNKKSIPRIGTYEIVSSSFKSHWPLPGIRLGARTRTPSRMSPINVSRPL